MMSWVMIGVAGGCWESNKEEGKFWGEGGISEESGELLNEETEDDCHDVGDEIASCNWTGVCSDDSLGEDEECDGDGLVWVEMKAEDCNPAVQTECVK